MSTTSSEALEYKVNSEGVALANERLAAMPQLAASMEAAVARLSAAMEESSRRQKAATETSEAAKQRAYSESARKFAESERKKVEDSKLAEQQKLQAVERELMTEEQLIRAHENERRRIIISNTQITEAKRNELLKLSYEKQRIELAGMSDKSAPSGLGTAGMVLGGLAVGAALMTAHSMMEVTLEFDRLNASLITVTGSDKEATKAFGALQSLAMTTPFTLREVTGAFVQLRNLGLNATSRELIAFGNMASAFGDTLDHMMLAVGDAAMGINRPLKQFGILAEESKSHTNKLSDSGKTVVFTFRGVSTEVAQSATAIEEYLVKLAENNFANAMANRMNTLDGAVSNLKDGWDKLVLAITQSGIESALAHAVTQVSDFVNQVSELIKKIDKTNKTGGRIKIDAGPTALYGSSGMSNGNVFRMGMEQKVITDEMIEAQQKNGLSALDKYLADQNKLREEKYREEYRQLIKNLKTKREALKEEYKKEMEVIASGVSGNAKLDAELREKARKKYNTAIAALDKKDSAPYNKAKHEYDRMVEQMEKSVDPLAQASYAYDEREKIILRFTKRNKERRAQLLRDNEAQYQKDVDKFIEAQSKEVDEVIRSLKTEEDAIQESYDHRRSIVEKNVTREEDRSRMLAAIKDQYTQQLQAFKEAQLHQREALTEELTTEEDRIRRSYDKRRRDVAGAPLGFSSPFSNDGDEKARVLRMVDQREANALQESRAGRSAQRATLLSNPNDQLAAIRNEEAAKLQALEEAHHRELISAEELEQAKFAVRQEYARKTASLEMTYAEESATSLGNLFGSLSTVAKNFGSEQSASYKTLFATQKAFAVAAGTLNMFQDISNASATPYPGNIPLMIKAAADGAALVAQISSVNYSGAYDLGGDIKAGKVGLVGEYGPELVQGPATVTGRTDTAKLLQGLGRDNASEQQPPNVNFNVGIDLHEAFNEYMSSTRGTQTLNVHIAKNWRTVQAATRQR